MKKNIFLSLLFVVAILMITGCMDHKKIMEDAKTNETNDAINESESDNNMEIITSMSITINGKKYKAVLEDNETAKTFAKILPQEFNMSELNGNEKYIYMDQSLLTNPSNLKHIVAGDIMLYGRDCLVIFYKSFDTNYSYTKIGHIDNLPSLGSDSIIVKFEK